MRSYNFLKLSAFVLLLFFALEGLPSIAQKTAITQGQRIGPINQRVDYVQREKQASPEIKSKLANFREQIKTRGRTFTVGYTAAMDVPIEVLAGTRIPRNLPSVTRRVNTRADQLRKIDLAEFQRASQINRNILNGLQLKCSASLGSWDWRTQGKVTPVKAQICGTCWDFTSMGAYEGSYAIRNNVLIDASEQYNLNCASAGDCSGGWWMPVFDHLMSNGTATEAADPFTGNDTLSCPSGTSTPYRASAWGFVGSDYAKIPPVADIKQALCDHGPLAIAVMADGPFISYTGGVFDETDQHFDWINHGVTLIGWDNSKGAWLIKNSWGVGWGETGGYGSGKGYMWIKWGSNNIGIATAWVDAMHRSYILPPDWIRALENEMIVKPLPPIERVRP
jgi:C1A family cysteine protease